MRSSYGWLVSNTVDDCLPSQIAKTFFKLKIEARPVNAGHYMAFKHSISFATDLAANLGCNRFRITPDIILKLLRATIWSCCAVQLESEQTPFPGTGLISFATDLAANVGCDRFRIMPDIVSKLLRAAIWISCVVQLESEQTPFPRTARRPRPAALHSGFDSEPAVLFLCHIFTQRSMNDHKIEPSYAMMGAALVGNNFWSIPWENLSSLPNIYKALKPF